MKIIGHHTCAGIGDPALIESSGPFYSIHDEEDPRQFKFLGSGYYFWDNNRGMAHSHGKNNYRGKYYIFEATLELDDDLFLDLAGNRIDMLWFQEIIEKLKKGNAAQDDWTLAHYIEFLKRMQKFEYRAIRAIDAGSKPKIVHQFVPGRQNFTNLNPVFIVCLLNDDKTMITSFKHIATYSR